MVISDVGLLVTAGTFDIWCDLCFLVGISFCGVSSTVEIKWRAVLVALGGLAV